MFPLNVPTIMRTNFVVVEDKFKREDLASAILHYVVEDLVDWLFHHYLANGVKRVFFFGSFVSPRLVRGLVTEEIVRRNILCVGTNHVGIANIIII